ncbi:hypothetical protein J5069_21825 [Candidatus Symbiopectobacterium sp. NZEC127]|uniref:hypothetical protein n=1 Tax=Candidatus Symbiopectobacterium sp. NZEC127 TaxID=2820472 RepID=UPI002225EF2F|nr:hypothetical protein [Candidatus Symbiopectobacterium sp. NZEC127]MCW2488548.1 hypothetical protein [Candidatus Symbiopectobacterium sp. NZEC127]
MENVTHKAQREHVNVLNVIYNPVSWIHPKRFSLPPGFSTPGCQRIINDILIENFSLSVEPLDLDNEREQYLATHWHLLPKAAFMVACQRHKSTLFQCGIWWKLEKSVRQFSLLNFLDNKQVDASAYSLEQYALCAKREIDLFSSSVSTVIRERLPLLFPPDDDSGNAPPLLTGDNELVMRMAIQHVQRS